MGRINRSYLKDKFLSTKGYKRNSPDVNNPYNVIPSNQITMEDVDFPVMGIDDLGNQQLMQPGKNYTFPGNYVTEFPLRRFQSGGTVSPPIKVDSDQYTSNPIKTDYVNFGNDNPNYSAVKWDPEEKRLVAVFEPVDIVAKRKKGFFTRWKSKSQQARENYSGQDNLRTDFYRKPDEVLAGEQQARNRDIQNKLHGTLRETTDEDRQDNRNSFTFVGQAAKRKGSADPIDYVLDIVNPAAYYYMGKDALSGVGQTAQGIYNLDPEQVGSGLLQTGLNAAAFLPALKSVPSAKSFSKFARLNPSQYKTLQGAVNNPTEYLTTQTPLKNTYKINPWAFKPNPNAFYRGIGQAGFDDAIESGVLRTNRNPHWTSSGKPGDSPYFFSGKNFEGIKEYEPNVITEVTNQPMRSRTFSKLAVQGDKSVYQPIRYTGQKFAGKDVVEKLPNIPLGENTKFYKKDWLRGYKPVEINKQLPGSPNTINQAGIGLFDVKGAFQKYPKGPLTQEEIAAYRNSPYYQKATKEHLDMVNEYGDQWTLGNYMEDALQEAITKGTRSTVNPILYGGWNWGTSDYVIAGLTLTAYPAVAGIMGLASSPPAVKNKALSKMGIIDPTEYGFLSKKDTTIDITNRPMSFAKVNQTADGNIIIGGEFIEDANNTVRKAKDWLSATDTYSDKKYSSKDIQSFYGIENGKFKVGKANEFNPETEIVPRRFGATNIDKAVLNGEEMRLLDKQGNPIYQNTPNTGKFILYSPSTGKAEFTYINTGKSGVNKVNDFLKKNKDAQYIHLDNGRYEYYGINPEGLTEQDFKKYYEQDFKREGNPGYNMILKKYGGLISKPKATYQMGGTMGIPGVNGQVVSQGPYPLDSVRKLGSYNQSGNGVKRMPRKAIKNILDNMR